MLISPDKTSWLPEPVFMLIQGFLPHRLEKLYGRIINISSTAEQTGGVIGLSNSYASILVKYKNITVNAIAPALIETDMIKDNPKIKPELIPIGRFGKMLMKMKTKLVQGLVH